jgi:hypothetical protein
MTRDERNAADAVPAQAGISVFHQPVDKLYHNQKPSCQNIMVCWLCYPSPEDSLLLPMGRLEFLM